MHTTSFFRSSPTCPRRLATLSLTATCLLLNLSTMSATYIRPAFGSPKTLLYIDGMDVFADKGGKKLLTIDDQLHVCTAAGKKLFKVTSDGEIHRESASGILVGIWQGSDLVRKGESPRIFFAGRYAEKRQEFRLKQGAEPIFVLEGDSINDFQRTALVYQLHPELLTPSSTEEAAATAVVSKAQAQAQHAAAPDTVTGDFTVKSPKGPWALTKVSFIWAKDHLHIQATGASALGGSALKFHEISTDHVVGGLTSGKGQVGVFRYLNGQYTGQWRDAAGATAKADAWTTDGNGAIASPFASKLGSLTFASAHKPLESEGRTYAVKSDRGVAGIAYQYYDSPENSGLIVVLGENAGVFRTYVNGNALQGGYYAGGDDKFSLYMQR